MQILKSDLLLFLYCILGFGVYVKNMQYCCIGTYMAMWFADSIPITYIWHFSHVIPPNSLTAAIPPLVPQQTPVLVATLPVSMCSHCSIATYEWEHAVFGFLFLRQFAENDGFQIDPCPYKGYELIDFYVCIVFHGVYLPHFLCPIYHWWAFGLVQVFAIVNSASINILSL